MPLWALALLFLLVPIAELYVIYQVGDAIGVAVDLPAACGGFAAGHAAAQVPGTGGVAALQRQPRAGPDAAPRGARRGARDLRRSVPDHARLPHGHRRPDAPDPAHALGDPALPRAGGWAAGWWWAAVAPTTTSRAARASTTSDPARGSSRERSGARAVLLRRGPRHSRDVAGGRDDPVRGPQAARAPRGARASSGAARAGAPSCPTGSRSSSSR